MQQGDHFSFTKSFTNEDVALFTKISGDEGSHHLTPDEQRRLVVQGLLTATLPTKIGGDHNVLARSMTFEFMRPVFTGDTITSEVTMDHLEQHSETRWNIEASFMRLNQKGKEVMRGTFAGVILA
ncbi:hotdog domain-containing protein [Salimicrobium flavidum]|uniref:Acyl dehydratase n=1 Tax=Salimicrobium flavidum TaxID=570947 RepID=A0A1N7J9Y0_9BACI|nr:hotdog domain-containing protein [Salimicrobium flavidum]SIS46138.1 Acyl dehydratase [Salimicrobium flavidum]